VHRIVIVIAMLGAAASAGCRSDSSGSRTQRRDDRVVSDVIARVGGRSIGASEVKRLKRRIRELERLLGKKTMEAEILKEAIEIAREKKLISRVPLPPEDDTP
jgi:hypothetical protein